MSFDGLLKSWGTLVNWLVNLQATPRPCPHYPGEVHEGVASVVDAVWDDVLGPYLADLARDKDLWVTGHSLGGALATLAAFRLQSGGAAPAATYCFGSPRVGNREFSDRYEPTLYRFENKSDIIPAFLPPPDDWPDEPKAGARLLLQGLFGADLPDGLFSYRHVGRAQFLHWDGSLREETPDWDTWSKHADSHGGHFEHHKIESYLESLTGLSAPAGPAPAPALPAESHKSAEGGKSPMSLVYVGLNGRVAAVDSRSGKLIWSWICAEHPSGRVALVQDGDALFVCADGYVFSLNPSTGLERWQNPLKGYRLGNPSLTLVEEAEDLVFVGVNGHVAGLDRETGKVRWKWTYNSPFPVSDTSIGGGGNHLTVAINGYVYGLDPGTGKQLWYNQLNGFGVGACTVAPAAP